MHFEAFPLSSNFSHSGIWSTLTKNRVESGPEDRWVVKVEKVRIKNILTLFFHDPIKR